MPVGFIIRKLTARLALMASRGTQQRLCSHHARARARNLGYGTGRHGIVVLALMVIVVPLPTLAGAANPSAAPAAPTRAADRSAAPAAPTQATAPSGAAEAPQRDASVLHEVTIVGQRSQRQIAGAAQHIGTAQLERQGYSDIQRILRQAPGVSLQVEDGYGLRPNIGVRGTATERSARITLLEDNVLIAPAPYSAPAAYYFPTVGRMSAVEILKGPAAITQGPYTIGGAVNLISTPIPQARAGMVKAEGGAHGTYRLHASYGGTAASGWGFLLETHQWHSAGYQRIDRAGSDSGLNVRDYTIKLAYSGGRHSVSLKWQDARQDSEQSYLGLSDRDFTDNAYRRYGLSALDNIRTQHDQQILRYRFDINAVASFAATAYNNEHGRDWFKTEGIDFDGSASAGDFQRSSWAGVISAVNRGVELAGISPAAMQGILDGADTPPGSVQLRSNARQYFSRGLQLAVDWRLETGRLTHAVEMGLRVHEDEEDRLQRNSTYRQQGGTLALDDPGLPGNAGNRLQEAKALAWHIYDRMDFGRWTLTPGLRYEDIDQSRTRWRTDAADPASRAAANLRDRRGNGTRVWLPGLGAIYEWSPTLFLVAGAHRGFTAPTNAPGVKEEKATNYELGLRHMSDGLRAEAIFFLTDYDDLLGICTASSGSDCAIGDAFNGDAATVTGVELQIETDLAPGRAFSLPLAFSYSWTDSAFDTDVADTDFFGDVSKGDPIPYIPEHQLNVSLGYLQRRWAGHLNLSYGNGVCARAACGPFERTDDTLTVDVSLRYALSDAIDLHAKVENLTAARDLVGRHPYGARPNKARTAMVGIRLDF